MPILIHENMNRGHTRKGWLDSFHTFSFGEFRDPNRMGFGALRVINEDYIIPSAGFARHDHADMDILTLVRSGRIRHTDSLGNVADIVPDEMQLMQAGSGMSHSEMNASDTAPAHVLQIWLIPDRAGGPTAYQRATLPKAATVWSLMASGVPGLAPLRLGSDTNIAVARPRDGDKTRLDVASKRRIFLQMIEGIAILDGERLVAGDGLQAEGVALPDLHWQTDGQVLLFDMAP
jgi:quercetin 2,3-dioxygenase